jgi:hypothetical protein
MPPGRSSCETASPVAFLVLIAYAVLWYIFKPETFEWHAGNAGDLVHDAGHQRAEHRDTRPSCKELDEMLHVMGDAENELTRVDEQGHARDRTRTQEPDAKRGLGVPLAIPAEPGTILIVKTASLPKLSRPRSEGLCFTSGDAMWMADLKHGEHVDELPAYAPAFKEVYRFILEALEGNDVAATRLFRKYLAGEMPEELLGIARCRETAEQRNRDKGDRDLSLQVAPGLAA